MSHIYSRDYFALIFFTFIMLFVLRQYFTFRKVKPLKYVLTPLVTASIMGFVILSIGQDGPSSYSLLIFAALTFSLIADVILMIEEVDLMKYGIVFFLMAHIAYTAAFAEGYLFRVWNLSLPLMFIFMIVKLDALFKEKAGNLRVPILVYMTVILTMAFFAITGLNRGVNLGNLTVTAGAALFLISDLTLAYNAFAAEIKHSSVFTWASYGPAQFLIAVSCFMRDF